jgi:hypothetical protein
MYVDCSSVVEIDQKNNQLNLIREDAK